MSRFLLFVACFAVCPLVVSAEGITHEQYKLRLIDTIEKGEDPRLPLDGKIIPAVLENAEALNAIARQHGGGRHGDGFGWVIVQDGSKKVVTQYGLALTPVFVFGKCVQKSELRRFLQARIATFEHPTTTNAMSGDRTQLITCILMLLAETADIEDVRLLLRLMNDPELHNRAFSAKILTIIQNNSNCAAEIKTELQPHQETIQFRIEEYK